jgi:hypothetical protein
MGLKWTNTFMGCVAACDITPGCIDVSWAPGSPGPCYMKNVAGQQVDNSGVFGAKIVSTAPSQTVSTSSVLSSSTASASTFSRPTQAPLSCDDNKSNGTTYIAQSGDLYQIICGLDYGGNDMFATEVENFEACIEQCNTQSGCVDVSYVYGTCYLKNSLSNSPAALGYVWTAKYIGGALSSTSSFIQSASTTTTISNSNASSTSYFSAPVTPSSCASNSDNSTFLPYSNSGINRADLNNLSPSMNAALNYAQPPPGYRAVSLLFDMIYPQVTLENSQYVSSVACSSASIIVTVSSQDAFAILQQWPQSNFVVITNSQGCNPSSERGVYLVQNATPNSSGLSITLQVTATTFKDVAEEMTIKYGTIVSTTGSSSMPFTSSCTSYYAHPSSTPTGSGAASTTAGIQASNSSMTTTTAPAWPTGISGDALELQQDILSALPGDGKGNYLVSIAPVMNATVEVSPYNPNDTDTQSALEAALEGVGMDPPDATIDAINNALDAASSGNGACPKTNLTSKRSLFESEDVASILGKRKSSGSKGEHEKPLSYGKASPDDDDPSGKESPFMNGKYWTICADKTHF